MRRVPPGVKVRSALACDLSFAQQDFRRRLSAESPLWGFLPTDRHGKDFFPGSRLLCIVLFPVRPQLRLFGCDCGKDKVFPRRRSPDIQPKNVPESNIIMSDAVSLCRNLDKYLDAIACAKDVTLQCLPPNYTSYILRIGLTAAMRAITKTCENGIPVVQSNCVLYVFFEVMDCVATKVSSYQQDGSYFGLLCFAFKAATECANKVFPTCGCQTTQLYVETFKLLNPTGCSEISVSTPVCRHETDEF